MREIYSGVKTQLNTVDDETLISYLNDYYSIDEICVDDCTTSNFAEFLEYEHGVVDYIQRDNYRMLRDRLNYLYYHNLIDRHYSNRPYIWYPTYYHTEKEYKFQQPEWYKEYLVKNKNNL